MKKIMSMVMVILVGALLVGCGNTEDEKKNSENICRD